MLSFVEEMMDFPFRFLPLLLQEGLRAADFLLHVGAFQERADILTDALAVFLEVAGQDFSRGVRSFGFCEFLAKTLIAREVSEDCAAEGADNERKLFHGGECNLG